MLAIERSPTGFTVLFDGIALLAHSVTRPCAWVGRGVESVDMYRGNFDIRDRLEERIALTEFSIEESPAGARILLSRGGEERLLLALSEEDGRLVVRPSLLAPIVIAGGPLSVPNRFWFRLPAWPGESVFGGGEQFSHFNLRGRRFPLWTSEQGVGRNKRTRVTWEADVADRAGGDYWWTFFPQPTFASSRHYWFHAECPAWAAFDFSDPGFHELEFWALPEYLVFGTGSSMLDLAKGVSDLLGRQPEPPDWTHDGIMLGMQGGTEVCEQRLRRAKAHGVPVNGIWAQDWEGINMTSFGQRLRWNWVWDPERYPGLPAAIERWRKEGVRFLGYANPYVGAGHSLFKEAAAGGFLARNAKGEDYLVDFGEFWAGIVDFTNPAAFDWYKGAMRKNLIDLGLSGWMADFGEYLPTDAVLFDGTPAMLAHNPWPAMWARVCHEAVADSGKSDEIVYFMRAGSTGSQRWCPNMWAGDQNVDWSEDDGLPSVITAALSLSVCGHGVHHSDIGGYTTLFGMHRTKELLLRWAEFAAFTPMMRSHEGNRPGDNWQFDSDDATLDALARLGRIFVAMKPYRKAALEENARDGVAAMRPLFFHYEDDPATFSIKDEYLFGRDLLVAPVVEDGAGSRLVHLPAGLPGEDWVHLWSGKRFGGGDHVVHAPLGEPPAFWRSSSAWAGLFVGIPAAAAPQR
ncbi:MAG: alpha-glucosidase [Spirochaetae bacterium HGW-Spirochaetae-7]|jgi:alpha-glucosidase|nr:MAG: alpha-glucosidase [Spirochaetae bacterium HGW-Spirochaetae-7]